MNLPSQYLSIIKLRYPDIRLDQLQVFDHGWDHTIIVVDQQTALRFPKHPDYAKRLPIEVAFLQHFSPQSPTPVPQMTLHHDHGQKLIYATYPFIQGVKFEKQIRQAFSTEEMLTIARQLGQFLTALHSFPVPQARRIGVEAMDQTLSYWQNRLTHIENTIFRLVSIPEQRWIKNLFTRFSETINQTDAKFVVSHGDIAPEHIIVNPRTHALSGIIDFGDISIGDPAYDFQLEHEFDPEFLHTVYRHYQPPRDANFEARRRFYEYSFIIRKIDNEINRGNRQQLKPLQAELTEFIRIHPLQ